MHTDHLTQEDFSIAYSRHFDKTIKWLISRGAPLDAAEEASQAAWTRGWERRAQLRNPRFLSTWINTIALNCYRRLLSRDKRKEALRDHYSVEPVHDPTLDLEKILSRCEEPDRNLLYQLMAGRSIQEIALERGTTNLAIRIRLSRARTRARKTAALWQGARMQPHHQLLPAG